MAGWRGGGVAGGAGAGQPWRSRVAHGVPVSICESRTANQSSCALIVLRAFPSASYLAYRSSNSFPHVSHSPGHSFGQKSDQSPPSSIRFMKRSGIHSA